MKTPMKTPMLLLGILALAQAAGAANPLDPAALLKMLSVPGVQPATK